MKTKQPRAKARPQQSVKLNIPVTGKYGGKGDYLKTLMATLAHSAFALMATGNHSFECAEVQQLVQLFHAADGRLQRLGA